MKVKVPSSKGFCEKEFNSKPKTVLDDSVLTILIWIGIVSFTTIVV